MSMVGVHPLVVMNLNRDGCENAEENLLVCISVAGWLSWRPSQVNVSFQER